MRPNVLLVVLDAVRRDALEPYGAPAGATPAIAQLARRGSPFERMFATACWTAPSHASMLTGLLPSATGVGMTLGTTPHKCAAALNAHADRLLPEVLRRHGYDTAAVSANLWLSEGSGFAHGFHEFVSVDSGRQGDLHRGSPGARLRWALDAVRATVDDGAREAERVLYGWLDRSRKRPFFWFVNLIEAHSPYLPPRPCQGLGALGRLLAAEEARRYLRLGSIWRACAGELEVPEPALERMSRLYRSAVRYEDAWLARVLEGLDRRGILDETLVIVTADHGENLGEGGLIGHALSLDNRLLHVPFICAGPGAPRDGQVHSLAELPRLVAEAVGLSDHPWGREGLPRDAAVAEFHPPSSRDDPRLDAAVRDFGLGERAVERLTTPFRCATDGRLKLYELEGGDRLYDLSADPLEEHPLPADGTAATEGHGPISTLRDALRHSAPGARPPAAEAGPQEAGRSPREPSPEELEQIEERMRLLGYM